MHKVDILILVICVGYIALNAFCMWRISKEDDDRD